MNKLFDYCRNKLGQVSFGVPSFRTRNHELDIVTSYCIDNNTFTSYKINLYDFKRSTLTTLVLLRCKDCYPYA